MLMCSCGYTYEYIDNFMTLPKLAALRKYWDLIPPLAISVAAIANRLGCELKVQNSSEDDAAKLAELASLASQITR